MVDAEDEERVDDERDGERDGIEDPDAANAEGDGCKRGKKEGGADQD